MNHRYILLFLSLATITLNAQNQEDKISTKGLPILKPIINNTIDGAPILGNPIIITGTKQEIRTEKHGLFYPAIFDWNGDGKQDLLAGEFETGETGSNIKVYLNIGTNNSPNYSGEYFYATDINGDTITTHQWCCIGIHPRIVDIDNDGYPDILSGQYFPGKISFWKGSKEGFQPRQFIEQEGYIEGKELLYEGDELDPNTIDYWNYSSAGFADFNGDGLVDLFVGGFKELRVALNIGTRYTPKFGLRKYLLGLDGLPLSVSRKPTKEETVKAAKSYRYPHYSGVIKSFINPVDWDGDGVLDLLVTHLYGDKNNNPVDFFRGIKTDKGIRFEGVKPLFTSIDNSKVLPGCQPNISVCDYNHDGINDLLVGISLPTVNGFEIDSLIAWSYLNELDIQSPGKDAGRAIEYAGGVEEVKNLIEKNPLEKKQYLGHLNDYKYLTLRHRGYLFLMPGKKNPVNSIARESIFAKDEVKRKKLNQTIKYGGESTPVLFDVRAPEMLRTGQVGNIEVTLSYDDGWYSYADSKANISMGLIPTKIEFQFPDGFEKIEKFVIPETKVKGGYEVYSGKNLVFNQSFRINSNKFNNGIPSGEYTIFAIITYQTCNENGCLPPIKETIEMKIKFVRFGD